MTAPQTPSGGVHGEGATPAGAHSRILRDADDDALVRALFCCTRFDRGRHCLRVKGHAGGCIAWSLHPLKHTDDHITYRRTA